MHVQSCRAAPEAPKTTVRFNIDPAIMAALDLSSLRDDLQSVLIACLRGFVLDEGIFNEEAIAKIDLSQMSRSDRDQALTRWLDRFYQMPTKAKLKIFSRLGSVATEVDQRAIYERIGGVLSLIDLDDQYNN